jgi:uncharacterized protein (DUF924 family)
MKTPQDVLSFWFDTHGPDDWFGAKAEFDSAIVDQFTDTHAAVARGESWDWRETPEGRLAEIIVLDQFSRQIFRDRAQAFATDPLALVLAQEMVGGGHHNFLTPEKRTFVLLPFMHSESPLMQKESVRLHIALGSENNLKFARGHAEIIERFGRFPRRNAALGRPSTEEEEAYMVATQGMF